MVVVCFDLDDTLIDSGRCVKAARLGIFDYVASNLDKVDVAHFERSFDDFWIEIDRNYVDFILKLGWGEREIRAEHLNRVLKACEIHDVELARELSMVYWNEAREGLSLFPEVDNVLSTLRKTFNLSLLSNGASDWQREKINVLELADFFDHIIIAGEVGHFKPSPEIFNILVGNYEIPADQIIYVGNNYDKDIMGARRAGLQAIWINRGGASRNHETLNPDYEIKDLKQLLNILQ